MGVWSTFFQGKAMDGLPAWVAAEGCHVHCLHHGLVVSPCYSSASKSGDSKLLSASWSCFTFYRSQFAVIQEVTEQNLCLRYQIQNVKGWCKNSTELKCLKCIGLHCRNQSHSLSSHPTQEEETNHFSHGRCIGLRRKVHFSIMVWHIHHFEDSKTFLQREQ